MFNLTPCHPTLLALHVLASADDFEMTSAEDDETTYTRTHAGWTTRLRALVRRYEPECMCPYCEECDKEVVETICFFVEMELEGMGTALRANTQDNLEDAFRSYEANVRSVINSFAIRLFRTRPGDITATQSYWPGTAFHAFYVLAYLGRIRWQEGKLAEATECYKLVLDFNFVKDLTDWTNDVKMRLAELKNELPFERRTSACVGWL